MILLRCYVFAVLFYGVESVSYTHLDVYKRQELVTPALPRTSHLSVPSAYSSIVVRGCGNHSFGKDVPTKMCRYKYLTTHKHLPFQYFSYLTLKEYEVRPYIIF